MRVASQVGPSSPGILGEPLRETKLHRIGRIVALRLVGTKRNMSDEYVRDHLELMKPGSHPVLDSPVTR